MTLSLLFWLTLAAAGVSFWWQSDRVRSFAYEHVLKYSRERGLQLLDQSLVLVGSNINIFFLPIRSLNFPDINIAIIAAKEGELTTQPV